MEGRKVIVCGGSRGIGAETVRYFTSNGDRVAFIYKSADDAAKALCLETGAEAFKADVSIPEEAAAAFNGCVSLLGGCDVLVCCAGIAHIGLLEDMTDSEIQNVLNTNLTSSVILAREASKLMVRNHSGSIVFTGSVWGMYGASCETVYSASKAGLRGLTFALAKELGPSGIRVNCVEPGVINTDMNACLDEATLKELREETPLCRIGEASEIAEAIGFLVSDKASFITGAVLPVNGGFPA